MKNEQILRNIKIIYFALITGVVGFAAVITFMTMQDQVETTEGDTMFYAILISVGVIPVLVTNFLGKKQLEMVKSSDKPLNSKLQAFMTISIIRWAGAEGACLLSIIAVMLSGNLAFFAATVVYLLYFLSLNPRPLKIADALDLTYDERHEIGIKG